MDWERDEKGDYPQSKLTKVSFVSFDAIADLAENAPLAAAHELQGACSTLETGYHEHLRKSLAAAYTVAYHMILNEYELKRFVELPLWRMQKRKPSTNSGRDHTLRFVLKYAFFSSPTTANTLSRYYVALQKMFNKGTRPETVRALIMKKGPEKLYEEAVARKKADRQPEDLNRFFADLDEADNDDTKDAETASGEAPKPGNEGVQQEEIIRLVAKQLDLVVELSALYNKAGKG